MMHAYLRRGLYAALLTSGGLLFAAGQASADDTTSGTESLLGGNQVTASVTAPVTTEGNAVALLDDAAVEADAPRPASSASAAGDSSRTTDGSESVAGGNQVNAPVTAPVTVGGNAVAVADEASVDGSSGSTAPGGSSAPGDSAESTDGSESVAGGNQVNAPVTAPITVGGNAVAVADEATAEYPTSPGMPGDGAGTSEPSDGTPVPGTSSGAPGDAGQPGDDGQGGQGGRDPQGTAGGEPGAEPAVTGALSALAAVRAASAVPLLAQTGLSAQLLVLALVALMSGWALVVIARRVEAVVTR